MAQAIPLVVPQFQQPPVQPVNPMDAAAKALGMVGQVQNIQAGNIGLQEKQQQLKDDQDLRAAASQAQGDPDKIYELLSSTNPRAAAVWGKQLADTRKAMTDTAKDQLANAQTRLDLVGQVTQGIKDDASFQLGKQQLTSALGPQAATILGDTYDPDKIKQISDSSLKHKDWLDAQGKAIDQARQAQELTLNKGKEDREARTAWEQSLGHAFMGTSSQDDFDNVKKSYSTLGAPKDLLGLYGEVWSPDVQKKAAAVLGGEAMKTLQDAGTAPPNADAAKKQMAAIFDSEKDPRYKNYAGQIDALGANPTPKALDDLVKEARKEAGQTRTAVATAQARQTQQDTSVNLTPAGLDIAATQFAKTGQLPPMGMGQAGASVRSKIINRAAELNPSIDIAANRADYDANKASLTGLQKNRDAVVSFENTANKNLDLLLGAADKIIDSGSPWINQPLRSVSQGAVGNANVPAFNAARQVAVNEIAKITSNPSLSGQLSDSARKEVESFIPESATFKQIVSVAKILKQDMKNRHDSLDEQIGAIQKRIKDSGTNAPKVGDTKTFTSGPSQGKTATWDGKGWKLP